MGRSLVRASSQQGPYLGILVASMGQRCSGVADMFGCPLEKPFSDCCEEMAAPFSNDTLDDLLSSPEESTTELAFTTTEPEDDVCPEGFSHNAEMNVCDDLNEVSEKLFLYKVIIFCSSVKKRIYLIANSVVFV